MNLAAYSLLEEVLGIMDAHRCNLEMGARVAYFLLSAHKYTVILATREKFLAWDSHVFIPEYVDHCSTCVPLLLVI